VSPRKEVKNIPASVRARLLNIAKQHKIDFNRILLLYFQQCFLARLAQSQYRDKFILKGGILFYGIHQMNARPTKDMDFLGLGMVNRLDEIEDAVKNIINIEMSDGVVFDPRSIHSETIVERKSYSGVRTFVAAKLDTAIKKLQIDVGFGDVMEPGPEQFDYPDLFNDSKIKIYAYSWSSVIAEKFEAIVSFSDLNSRMKDYFDIYYLQHNFDFDGTELGNAVRATFSHRNTDISASNYIFTEQFMNDTGKQKQWLAFIGKINSRAPGDFSNIIKELKKFIGIIIFSIASSQIFAAKWDHNIQKWLLNES